MLPSVEKAQCNLRGKVSRSDDAAQHELKRQICRRLDPNQSPALDFAAMHAAFPRRYSCLFLGLFAFDA